MVRAVNQALSRDRVYDADRQTAQKAQRKAAPKPQPARTPQQDSVTLNQREESRRGGSR